MYAADADGIYLVKPEDEPQTQLYKSLGVKLTDLKPDGDYYSGHLQLGERGDGMTTQPRYQMTKEHSRWHFARKVKINPLTKN